MNRAVRALVVGLWSSLAASGCLWSPNIEGQGYNRCQADADCAPGRACEVGLCAPPPWNDDAFGARQLFVVENKAATPLPAGAAVPLRVGAGGVIESRELGVDGRFTFFDKDALAWSVTPVFRDIYDDHLLTWIPLGAEVPAGQSAPLAWLETQTGDVAPTILEDPSQVFLFFDELEGTELDPERYDTFGTGTPTLSDGHVNVADNQRLVATVPLAPPVSVVFRGRINGATCSRFYVGLTANDDAGYAPPSAGFFSNAALELVPEVAPDADSVPRPVGDNVPLDTAQHRFRIDVGDGRARFSIDDDVVAEPDLRPPLEAEALYFRLEVDGACSFDLERLMVTPLPIDEPVVTAEARVEYEIFN